MIVKCLLSCTLAASRVCEGCFCGGKRQGWVARKKMGKGWEVQFEAIRKMLV